MAPPPASNYPWLRQVPGERPAERLAERFSPPAGYDRLPGANHGFADWLRNLPLRPEGTAVHLHSGHRKPEQGVHVAVVDIDTGRRDLQQCADAVMRLRAEYLFATGCQDAIRFNFTSGDPARWTDWRSGMRPQVNGNQVVWRPGRSTDDSHANFRKYLDIVFTYAGSASLVRELKRVENPAEVLPGDVFIQGGYPGHAVLVLDVVQNQNGERRFLIGQSYMPAQDFHILKNPGNRESAWYPARSSGALITPEWRFRYEDLHRFHPIDCRPGSSPGR